MKKHATGRLGRLFFKAVTLESRSPGPVVIKQESDRDAGSLRAAQPSSMTLCDERRSGFTLIELLVVVLIIGILAAVALPQYQLAVRKSRYASLKPLVRAISDAEQAYHLSNGQYTTDFDELSIGIAYTSSLDNTAGTKIYYFGGDRHCWNENAHTFCAYTEKIGYRLDRATKRQCCDPYTDNLSVKICKQESNLSEANWGGLYCWSN